MMKGMAAVVASAEEALRRRRTGWTSRVRCRRQPAASSRAAPSRQQTEAGDPNALEPTIYRFILKHSLHAATYSPGADPRLVSVSLLSRSILPKTIVNQAIGGKQFPQEFLGYRIRAKSVSVDAVRAFLALVFINGGFKYCINTFKGRLGERMLRRFRYQLYQRMLRFPLTQFQQDLVGPDHPDDHGGVRVAGRLHRRRLCARRRSRAARC